MEKLIETLRGRCEPELKKRVNTFIKNYKKTGRNIHEADIVRDAVVLYLTVNPPEKAGLTTVGK